MKRYIKLPSRKTEYRLKNGFSLAEAMVMLVVISILLAVSAPLIAKKSNADQRRLVVQSGVNPVTAMGNNQNFGIGQNNPTAKLEVQGNDNTWRKVARFVSTISGNNSSTVDEVLTIPHNISIFEVIPNNDTPEPSAANKFFPNRNGFKVFADGTTNVRTCVPNWTNIPTVNTSFKTEITTAQGVKHVGYNPATLTYTVNQDGYIIASHCITDNTETYKFCPSKILMERGSITPRTGAPVPSGITLMIRSDTSENYINKFDGQVIIPVIKDMTFKEIEPSTTEYDEINKYNFVPCLQQTLR